jgi:CheY-like chemotaxis protein
MSLLLADTVEKVGVLTRPNFFSAVGAVFRFGRGGASSSTSDSTERVLNRSAAAINVNRRCRWYFSIVAVVDDDPSMLRAAEDLLDAHGFATKVFASAEEFLDRGAANQVDCLLLDIHLGGMSGIELRHQLTASGSTLSVIFMTAIDGEAIREEALKAGCVAYLRKPFLARQLIDAIEKAAP